MKVGKRVFVKVDCVMLDIRGMNIGDGVLSAPGCPCALDPLPDQ
jgi:acetyltransferase-like isoleucine patch superfamily enzyme